MVQNLNLKNTTKQECIYGWYPGKSETPRSDPKDIYCNLGSRPPRNQSYAEAEVLYRYHESIKPSELIYKPKQTVDEALKTPWSLHMQMTAERDEYAKKTIPEAYALRRSQSAPYIKPAPNHRIILKIPTPQFPNNVDSDNENESVNEEEFLKSTKKSLTETEIVRTSFSAHTPPKVTSNYISEPLNTNKPVETTVQQQQQLIIESKPLTPPTPPKSQVAFESKSPTHEDNKSQTNEPTVQRKASPKIKNEPVIDKSIKLVTALNIGKKSMIFDNEEKNIKPKGRLGVRPKTAGNLLRTSSGSLKTSIKQRPKTCTPAPPVGSVNDSINIVKQEKSSDLLTVNTNEDKLFNLNSSQETEKPQNETIKIELNPQQQLQQRLQQQGRENEPTVLYVDPSWIDSYLNNRQKSKTDKTDYRVVEGNWRDQVINRSKYLHKRPNYYVKINMDKLKPDPAAPEVHYKAPDTYFYNTLPQRRAAFTIDPNFISENLNVKKVSLAQRSNSSGAIRYRRDYAFVY